MLYTSTLNDRHTVTLAEAVEHPVAPDGGLYVPEHIPLIPKAFFNNVAEMSLRDTAYIVASAFMGSDLPADVIKRIVDESFAFEAPLRRVEPHTYALELFHGPTLTFKDYGARFMARVLHHLGRGKNCGGRRLILVATLGNSGAATANGFHGLEGLDVIALYPRGRLSRLQSAQLTAPGGNIHAVEVAGTVDDCKAMLSEALRSDALKALCPTAANSINIARIIPQIAFAIHAYGQLIKAGEENPADAIYSVPCGNLGNLAALMTATLMGMPASGIIAASNINDSLGKILRGESLPANPVATLTPSMDLVAPANIRRIEWLMKKNGGAPLATGSVTDTETVEAVAALGRLGFSADTHSAAAYTALMRETPRAPRVFYATAHPAKNIDLMTRITGRAVELPVQLMRFMAGYRRPPVIAPTLPALIKHIKSLGLAR